MSPLPPEDRLVARLQTLFATRRRDVALGIGDDAAVVRARGDLVATTDALVEGEDFFPDADPQTLGRKALSVNLSDLAAMGATPLYALLTLGLPPGTDPAWFEALAQGVRSAASDHGIAVVGGDLSASRLVFLSVTAFGSAPRAGVLKRSGARAGDTIFVSGTLGAAAAGLALLAAGYRPGDGTLVGPNGRRVPAARASVLSRLIRHQTDPRPMVELGKALAEEGLASSAIDVSDSLAKDLHRLCRASDTGAVVNAAALPADSALSDLSRVVAFDPTRAVLYGGEDYGLLFTVSKRKLPAVSRLSGRFAIRPIGEMNGTGRVAVLRDGSSVPLPDSGFDHFQLAG